MAAKKESMASLKRQVAELTQQVAKLEKDKGYAESLKETYYKQSNERKEEIEAVHDLLDVLPGAIPKKKEEFGTHALMTRLASYLANRN
jgi:hypothetical protein